MTTYDRYLAGLPGTHPSSATFARLPRRLSAGDANSCGISMRGARSPIGRCKRCHATPTRAHYIRWRIRWPPHIYGRLTSTSCSSFPRTNTSLDSSVPAETEVRADQKFIWILLGIDALPGFSSLEQCGSLLPPSGWLYPPIRNKAKLHEQATRIFRAGTRREKGQIFKGNKN